MGTARIVCDSLQNTVQQGHCYTYLATGVQSRLKISLPDCTPKHCVSKCSATLASCSTPWSATELRRAKLAATPLASGSATPPKSQDECYRGVRDGFWGGGRVVTATPLRHTRNCGKSRNGGVTAPCSTRGRGV